MTTQANVKTESYLETYRRVAEEKRADYHRASAGQMSWREYAQRWGVN